MIRTSVVYIDDDLALLVAKINAASWDEANEMSNFDVPSLRAYLERRYEVLIPVYELPAYPELPESTGERPALDPGQAPVFPEPTLIHEANRLLGEALCASNNVIRVGLPLRDRLRERPVEPFYRIPDAHPPELRPLVPVDRHQG